jgi:flavorubredoxin
MSSPLGAVKVSEHVYWVGAIDWSITDFHGYSTRRGTTYNAYLVIGDDVILIDTVKAQYRDELLSRISSVTDPKNIRYLISNHSEPDHTGSLPSVLAEVEPEKVFASPMGVKALGAHYHMDREIIPIKDAEQYELGGLKLTSFETRMLHWPDSMVTYLADDKLLFSQDGFGMHLATSERYADELPDRLIFEEGAKYYANILLPYSNLVTKLLEKIDNLGVEIDFICPDHGPIWRKGCDRILGLWGRWAAQNPTNKAVVVYDTMWGSTDLMGRVIGDSLAAEGVDVKVMPLKACDRAAVVTQVLDAGALVVGTPTLNNGVFPTVADVLTYLKGLKPKNLIGAAFGSYGWSGEGAKLVNQALSDMKVEIVQDPLNLNYVPDGEGLDSCRRLGAAVAARLKEVVGGGS